MSTGKGRVPLTSRALVTDEPFLVTRRPTRRDVPESVRQFCSIYIHVQYHHEHVSHVYKLGQQRSISWCVKSLLRQHHSVSHKRLSNWRGRGSQDFFLLHSNRITLDQAICLLIFNPVRNRLLWMTQHHESKQMRVDGTRPGINEQVVQTATKHTTAKGCNHGYPE